MTRLLIPTKPEFRFGLDPTDPARSPFGPGYLLDCEGDPPGSAWLARIEVEADGWSATVKWFAEWHPLDLRPWWKRVLGIGAPRPEPVTCGRRMVLRSEWDRALEADPSAWRWEDNDATPPMHLARWACDVLRRLRATGRGFWESGTELDEVAAEGPYR